MASSSSSSASQSQSSSTIYTVTREEFNAFHKVDRDLFTRLVLNLRRDKNQSLQVMSFLYYLEKSISVRNLILNLTLSPDHLLSGFANEVLMCLNCLYYEEFATFVTSFGPNIDLFTLPFIIQLTGQQLTLAGIHQNRENILSEMNKYTTTICQPVFQDICAHAENMYRQEWENTMMPFGIGMPQYLNYQQQTTNHHVPGTSNVGALSTYEQVLPLDRTVFLTFTQGYPVSVQELHSFFTRRFGIIIEAIYVPEMNGNEPPLFAKVVLRSADKVPEIISGENNTNTFIINGKLVKVRKYSP